MSSYKMTHKHLDELLATRPTCTIDHVVFYTGESKDTLKLQFDDAWMRDWPGRVDQLPRLHVYIDGNMSSQEMMAMDLDEYRWVDEWVHLKTFDVNPELWVCPRVFYQHLGSLHPPPGSYLSVGMRDNGVDAVEYPLLEYHQAADQSGSLSTENPFFYNQNEQMIDNFFDHADYHVHNEGRLFQTDLEPGPSNAMIPRNEQANPFGIPDWIRRPQVAAPDPQDNIFALEIDKLDDDFDQQFAAAYGLPISGIHQLAPQPAVAPASQSIRPSTIPDITVIGGGQHATRIATTDGKWECSFCHKEYKTSAICDRHILEHTVGKVQCPFKSDGNCGRGNAFARYDKLREHVEKRHKTISLDHPLLKEIYDKHLHRGSKPKTGALKQNKMKAHGSSSASSSEEKEE